MDRNLGFSGEFQTRRTSPRLEKRDDVGLLWPGVSDPGYNKLRRAALS
jgi:hypothetical protein